MEQTETTLAPLSVEQQVAQIEALLAFDGDVSTANQKAALTSIAHVKGSTINVDIDKLRLKAEFNPRIRDEDYYTHIRKIANSIKAEGFYADKPLAGIVAIENKRAVIHITDGQCRYEATMLAKAEGAEIHDLPLVLKEKATTIEDLTVALVRTNSGKPFKPLELSIIVKRLSNYRLSISEIAARLDFTVEYVNQLLHIAGAPLMIRQMIQDGEVPAAVALQSLRTHGDEAVAVLQTAVKSAKASGRTGITRKHLPEQIHKKAVAKAAPKMVAIIERVKTHEAFQTFPKDLQEMIEKIIKDLNHPVLKHRKQDVS